jgi:hypothetical protein
MVDLLADDPSLEIRALAAIVARGWKGTLSTHVERLRKKYRKLRDSGQLPSGGTAARAERTATAIRDLYQQDSARVRDARTQLEEAERAAEALGLNLNGLPGHLHKTLRDLHDESQSLENLTEQPTEWMVASLMGRGFGAEEAVAAYHEAVERRRVLALQIEALTKVRNLRSMARVPDLD